MCDVVCRFDGRPCWSSHPCVSFHPSGNGCVVCERYQGEIEVEEYNLEVNV